VCKKQLSKFPYLIEESDDKLYVSEKICLKCQQQKENLTNYIVRFAYGIGILVSIVSGSPGVASAVNAFTPRFCPHNRFNGRPAIYSNVSIFKERSARAPKENSAQHDSVVTPSEGEIFLIRNKQVQKKWKHRDIFDMIDCNFNLQNAELFKQKIIEHVNNPNTEMITGTYRSDDVTHYFNSETNINVIIQNDEFLSCWLLGDEQVRNVLERGSL